MSARVTKKMSVNISAGTFKTFEEAVKEANAIKGWLNRLCKRKGYSCRVMIGVSENNPHTGKVTGAQTGKPGRPKISLCGEMALCVQLRQTHIFISS